MNLDDDLNPPPAPDGYVYEWKVFAVLGEAASSAEYDAAAGWAPVPQDRHPGFPVEFGGLRLMERPVTVHATALIDAHEMARAQADGAARQGQPLEDGDAILTDRGWMPMGEFRKEQELLNGKGGYRGFGGMSHLWRVADFKSRGFDISIVPDWVEDGEAEKDGG